MWAPGVNRLFVETDGNIRCRLSEWDWSYTGLAHSIRSGLQPSLGLGMHVRCPALYTSALCRDIRKRGGPSNSLWAVAVVPAGRFASWQTLRLHHSDSPIMLDMPSRNGPNRFMGVPQPCRFTVEAICEGNPIPPAAYPFSVRAVCWRAWLDNHIPSIFMSCQKI
jgi:hypothetical protein